MRRVSNAQSRGPFSRQNLQTLRTAGVGAGGFPPRRLPRQVKCNGSSEAGPPSVRNDWDENYVLVSTEAKDLEREIQRLKKSNEALRHALKDASEPETGSVPKEKPVRHTAPQQETQILLPPRMRRKQESSPKPQTRRQDVEKKASKDGGNGKKGGDQQYRSKVRENGRMSIVFVSAEVSPWSKTGGLGDVAGSLPVALAKKGHRVMVVTPRYLNGVTDGLYACAHDLQCQVPLHLGHGGMHEVRYYHLHRDGVDWVFVDNPCFHRPGGCYGDSYGPYKDNVFRYAILSMAACEAPLHIHLTHNGKKERYGQDVTFVANDWHSGLVPVYVSSKYRPNGVYTNARCVLAIHNLAHQGIENPIVFKHLGLSDKAHSLLEWVAKDGHRSLNIMKGAIVTCDRIVTVSRAHAWDITRPEGSMGLDPLLPSRQNVINGVVNGIDTKEWSPETDEFVCARYSYEDMRGKRKCKMNLQRELGFPPCTRTPLVGFVGRLDQQKGPDLVLDALPYLALQDCQVVMLGSGNIQYEEQMKRMEKQYGDFFRDWVGFSVPLSHKIIAGCDILLIPSRFEPCGLTQLYAMRYGTLPVARATGGLSDTIEDVCAFGGREEEEMIGTGFLFNEPTVDSMMEAVRMAVKTYREEPKRWKAIQKGMLQDFSWAKSASMYEEVLRQAMAQEHTHVS